MRNQSGFTLLELMITIGIIAIIMAGVVPNMISWRNNAQLSAGARQIYSDLQGVRKVAIKTNRIATVDFGASTYTLSLPSLQDPSVIETTSRDLPPGVIINSALFASPDYDDNRASFNGLGFARDFLNNANSGTVTIRLAGGSNRASRITVDSGGSMSIQRIQ